MTTPKEAEWKLWFQWIAVHMGACIAAIFIFNPVQQWAIDIAQNSNDAFTVAFIISALSLWSLLGAMEYLLLRTYLPSVVAWVLASIAGGAVGLAVIWSVTAFSTVVSMPQDLVGSIAVVVMYVALIGAAFGGAPGLFQWLVLRRWIDRAGWWVLASTAGWALAVIPFSLVSMLAYALFHAPGPALPFWQLLAWVVTAGGAPGLISGAITGAVLIGLLRRRANNGDYTFPR